MTERVQRDEPFDPEAEVILTSQEAAGLVADIKAEQAVAQVFSGERGTGIMMHADGSYTERRISADGSLETYQRALSPRGTRTTAELARNSERLQATARRIGGAIRRKK